MKYDSPITFTYGGSIYPHRPPPAITDTGRRRSWRPPRPCPGRRRNAEEPRRLLRQPQAHRNTGGGSTRAPCACNVIDVNARLEATPAFPALLRDDIDPGRICIYLPGSPLRLTG